MHRNFLALGLLFTLACGGKANDDRTDVSGTIAPPPVATHFTVRYEGTLAGLEEPYGIRFTERDFSYLALGASEPRRGDDLRSAGIHLLEPLALGTLDCTPDERGETSRGASLSVTPVLPSGATITECSITVEYFARDRVVGRFQATATYERDPAKLVAGSFDVPIEDR